jgi:hypothetical protein
LATLQRVETEDGTPAEAAPRRKRRRKRRHVEAPAEPSPLPVELGNRNLFRTSAAVVAVTALLVGTAALGPAESPYALVILGIASFVAGSSFPEPRKTVLLSMAVAAAGLAGLATSSSPWAIAIAVVGGLGLGGGIHLLGRMGAETPDSVADKT